jgi:fatty-acyl-CoA synthase
VAAQSDPQWGEAGCAFVQLQPGAAASDDELTAWARTRLAKFECPVRWVRMDALPLNAAGKVDRLALRAAAVQPGPLHHFSPDS